MTQKYVKYISENEIELAPTNYTLEDGTIIFNFNKDEAIMLQYSFKPLLEVERPETDRFYKITYKELRASVKEVLTYLETEEEYEERKATKERARLDSLTLTPADTWRIVYKDKQMTQEQVLALIEEQMTGVDMNAIKIEFGANLYYRGAKYGDSKIFDVIGNLLGYTSDDMDYLFEHKELPEV